MNNNPLVSVIMPTYNCENYIEESVKSVLKQTYYHIELIIIDDGSTDGTRMRLAEVLKDNRVNYIYQKNSGQAKARNVGISAAKGDLIAFLDADDLWREDKLEKQIRVFKKVASPVGVMYSRYSIIDESGRLLVPLVETPVYRGIVCEQIFFNNFISFSTAIVRKTVFLYCGYFDETLERCEDWDFWLRVSVKYQFEYIDEPLGLYRQGRVGQLTQNTYKAIKASDRIIQKFLSENPNVFSKKILKKKKIALYNSRCLDYIPLDRMQALKMILQSLVSNPFQMVLYKNTYRVFISFVKKEKVL